MLPVRICAVLTLDLDIFFQMTKICKLPVSRMLQRESIGRAQTICTNKELYTYRLHLLICDGDDTQRHMWMNLQLLHIALAKTYRGIISWGLSICQLATCKFSSFEKKFFLWKTCIAQYMLSFKYFALIICSVYINFANNQL